MGENPSQTEAELLAHVESLRGLATFLVQGRDSDDLVQDAVITTLLQTRPPRQLGPWLKQVVRNRAKARARGEARRATRERESGSSIYARARPGFDEDLERQQLLDGVRESLEELPEPYRQVLVERFLEGRSPSEIAEELDLAPATVRWRVHEGLRRLRIRLDERFEGRGQWTAACAGVFGLTWESSAMAAAGSAHRSLEHVTMKENMTLKAILAGLVVAAGGTVAVVSLARATEVPQATDSGRPGPTVSSPAVVSTSTSDPGSGDDATAALAESVPAAFTDSSGAVTDCEGPKCAWSVPQYAHCPGLVDPLSLEESIQIATSWTPDSDGVLQPSVTATSGCYDEDPCSGVERPRCEEGQAPSPHPEIEACYLAVAMEQGPPDAPDITRFQHWIDPAPAGCEALPCEEQTAILPPPRADIAEVDLESAVRELDLPGLQQGDGVAMLECGGYSCAFCNKARETVDELLARHPDMSMHWLNFPLEWDARSVEMAKAAVAAQKQGFFPQFHDALFDKAHVRADADLQQLARAVGMDLDQFATDMRAPETAQLVSDQRAFCQSQGIQGTPGFMIDGSIISGAQPIETFDAEIEAAQAVRAD